MSQKQYYNQPIRSLQTMLQAIERMDGTYRPVIPDGIYGPDTMSSVSNFQRNHAIPVTGVVNQDTWERIVIAYESALVDLSPACPLGIPMDSGEVYEMGCSKPNIRVMQSMLYALFHAFGYSCGPESTGVLDESTRTAVELLQELCNLPVSGTIDKQTWKHLALLYPPAVMLTEAEEEEDI